MDMYNDNMETARPILPVRWMQVLCILAGIYAVAVASSIFVEMVKPEGREEQIFTSSGMQVTSSFRDVILMRPFSPGKNHPSLLYI